MQPLFKFLIKLYCMITEYLANNILYMVAWMVVHIMMYGCLKPPIYFSQEFRRMSLSGYMLNREEDSFYYLSLSRLHPQRIHANKRLSESTSNPSQQTSPCTVGAQVEDSVLESEVEADSEVSHHPFLNLFFSLSSPSHKAVLQHTVYSK